MFLQALNPALQAAWLLQRLAAGRGKGQLQRADGRLADQRHEVGQVAGVCSFQRQQVVAAGFELDDDRREAVLHQDEVGKLKPG